MPKFDEIRVGTNNSSSYFAPNGAKSNLRYEDLPDVNSERWLSLDDFQNEVWREIDGFDGVYKVSSYGRIKSSSQRLRILRTTLNKSGYYYVSLVKKWKVSTFRVHRLVCQAFCANPHNYTEVNHKDEIKTNNIFTNLEWCSHLHNVYWGTRNARISQIKKNNEKVSYPISQYTIDGHFIKSYPSIAEAARQNKILVGEICRAVNGVYPTYKRYVWLMKGASFELWRRENLERLAKMRNKPIYKFDLNGVFLSVYENSKIAAKDLGNEQWSHGIIACCKGKQRTAYGFIWRFTEII